MQLLEPSRVKRRYVQRLVAPPDQVFPLLCPVRETEWVEDWDPLRVYTASGVAEPECVFVTADAGVESTWVVTRHDPRARVVEMVKFTPGSLVTRLRISLEPAADGGTLATVVYTFLAATEAGRLAVVERTEEAWVDFMQQWESAMNEFFARGDG